MKFIPRSEQPKMIDWCLTRPQSALIALPGAGKSGVSLTVLDTLMTNGESRGALIVAPKRVCSITWPNQIEKWDCSSWMKVAHLRTPEGLKAWDEGSADIYLINPEMLPSFDVSKKCTTCMETCQDCRGTGGKKTDPCKTCKGKKANKKIKGECPACKGKWLTKTRRIGVAEKIFKGRKTIPVDTFIWDELSLACNHSTKSADCLRPFLPMFKQRIGLTGTPVPNNYMDLFSQARLIDDGKRLGTFFTHFRSRYFEQEPYKQYSYVIRPGAKEAIDQKLSDIFLIVNTEEADLPSAAFHDVEVALPTSATKEYKTLEKELLLELKKGGNVVASNAATLCGKLRQIVSGSVYDEDRGVHHLHDVKMEALKKLRKKHGKEPILVLTSFIHETDRILAEIPGAKKFHERDMAAWRRGEIETWVSNCKSLSHGIDGIQDSCRIIVWFTLGYSSQDYKQTNKRVWRPGQKLETIIYHIIAPDTIDEAVVEALKEKGDTERGMMEALKNLQRLREVT